MSLALSRAHIAQAAAEGVAAGATNYLTGAMVALEAAAAPLIVPLAIIVGLAKAVEYAYDALTASTRRKTEAIEKAKAIDDGAALALEHLNERVKIANDGLLDRINYLDTAAQKEKALRDVLAKRAEAEQYVADVHQIIAKEHLGPQAAAGELEGALEKLNLQRAAAEKLLDLTKENAREKEQSNKSLIEAVQLRERELRTAQDLLKTEKEKDQTLRASIGMLNAGERKQLKRAVEDAEQGKVTKRDAEILQKFGGAPGKAESEKFFSKLDEGIAGRLEKLIGDPFKEAQKAFVKAAEALSEKTGGKTATDKVHELERENDELVKTVNDGKQQLNSLVRGLIDEILKLRGEISLQKQGAAVARARN
jgi:hypothetical protein